MARRLFNLLHKEVGGLHEAAYLLGFFALLSQVLALVRDRLFAYHFGAGHTLDVYYAAFRIPDFIFVSVASLVSVSVLVPYLIEKIDRDHAEGKRFIDSVFGVFFLLITASSIIVFFLVPVLIPLFLPGFAHDPMLKDLVTLTRILLLSPILLGISNFLASITQAYNRFFIYAVSPLLYNLGIIIGIVGLYPYFGLPGLGFGVVLGAFLHLIVQVPFVVHKKLLPRFAFTMSLTSVLPVFIHSLPRTLALSANQIATFFLVALASLQSAGSISVFNFAFNLQSVPLAIIGVSYSSAAFPTLSRLFQSGERQKFIEQVVIAAKHIIFWSVPVVVLFIVLRAQIVRTILGSGSFSWTDTRLTAAALALFTISVSAQSLVMLFVRAYYSSGNTKKPLIINVSSSVIIVVLGYLLLILFERAPIFHYFLEALLKVPDVPGSMVLVLPLAYSVGVFVNAVFHWYIFQKEFTSFSAPVLQSFFQSLSASVIMGYVAYLGLNFFDDVFDLNTLPGIFMQGFCAGVLGIIAGVIVLKLLKNKELDEVWKTLHRKIWRVKVIGPEQGTL